MVGKSVGMLVTVAIAVFVAVAVGRMIGVFVAIPSGTIRLPSPTGATIDWLEDRLITSCGAFPPVLLEKPVPVPLVESITKVYCPAPVIADVTFTCVHVLAAMTPELPKRVPSAGALP